MTNNHILNKDNISIGQKINFSTNNEKTSYGIKIEEIRKIYKNDKFDVLIIELKEFDKLYKITFFIFIKILLQYQLHFLVLVV